MRLTVRETKGENKKKKTHKHKKPNLPDTRFFSCLFCVRKQRNAAFVVNTQQTHSAVEMNCWKVFRKNQKQNFVTSQHICIRQMPKSNQKFSMALASYGNNKNGRIRFQAPKFFRCWKNGMRSTKTGRKCSGIIVSRNWCLTQNAQTYCCIQYEKGNLLETTSLRYDFWCR